MTRQPDLDDLEACVDELLGRDRLLARVLTLLPYADDTTGFGDPSTASTKTRPGDAPSAPIPWNDAAASWVIDLHADVRKLERNLQLAVHQRARYRGGSDANTAHALRALPDLVALAHEQDQAAQLAAAGDAVDALRRWPRQARAILDEARTHEVPWTPAPGRVACPHCGRRLHLRPGWERDARPELWCRACPAELEADEQARPDRRWPASQWLGQLQDDRDAS